MDSLKPINGLWIKNQRSSTLFNYLLITQKFVPFLPMFIIEVSLLSLPLALFPQMHPPFSCQNYLSKMKICL